MSGCVLQGHSLILFLRRGAGMPPKMELINDNVLSGNHVVLRYRRDDPIRSDGAALRQGAGND